MKVHELLDSPEKWWDGSSPKNSRECLYTGILKCYSPHSSDKILRKVRTSLGTGSISNWNDSHTWQEVHDLCRELDI